MPRPFRNLTGPMVVQALKSTSWGLPRMIRLKVTLWEPLIRTDRFDEPVCTRGAAGGRANSLPGRNIRKLQQPLKAFCSTLGSVGCKVRDPQLLQ